MNERKNRTHKKGLATVIDNYRAVGEDWFPSYYLQYARTLNLERDYGHPNIQALINFNVEMGDHMVINQVYRAIKKGAYFKAGDRFTVREDYGFKREHTVEFFDTEDCYGTCLRAVVLGLESELQSLPTNEALAQIEAVGPGIDPYEYL
ncbi:MAG: hypothetical protein J6A78_06385 [Clostridia bacterium]|nr:hypothetical protein [Clostridia bacterium]